MKTWYEYQTCLGSENGRVKNMEESEGQDFLKVLQNEERKKKKRTQSEHHGRALRNPKGATEVVRKFRKKAAGFSRKK